MKQAILTPEQMVAVFSQILGNMPDVAAYVPMMKPHLAKAAVAAHQAGFHMVCWENSPNFQKFLNNPVKEMQPANASGMQPTVTTPPMPPPQDTIPPQPQPTPAPAPAPASELPQRR